MGQLVLSPRERERRDRKDSRGDKREVPGRKRNRTETEEIKTGSPLPIPATRIAGIEYQLSATVS